MNDFLQFKISDELIKTLESRQIIQPTEIQNLIIPILQKGKNVFFESETGSGKTLAFLLPAITKTLESNLPIKSNPQVLIISPTIELASQIKKEVQLLSNSSKSLKSFLAVGGSSVSRQIESLKQKPQIIIGNPGRIANLTALKKFKLDKLHTVIFDEADRLTVKEMRNFIQAILQAVPKKGVQYSACSATLSEETCNLLSDLIKTNTDNFEFEYKAINTKNVLQKSIEHWAIFSEQRKKTDTLKSFIKATPEDKKILVFTSPAKNVEPLCKNLNQKKITASALYTNLKNQERQQILDNFRNGKVRILITSDLAARGLDIPNIDYVVQMNVPKKNDFYIHRAGRTARAGTKGVTVCIGDAYEMRLLKTIEQDLNLIVYPKKVFGGKISSEG
ncbi:MAG: RNA helicase [Treponema sp.]|nr:MAG: RNA helicase [Treponema sp.]